MSKKYRPEGRYQVTSHAAAIIIVLIIFVSVSYYFFLARPDEQAQRIDALESLAAAESRWEENRPAAFRYVVDRSCDCPDEDGRAYTVTERDGRLTAEFAIPVESSAGILVTAPPRPVGIEDVFAVVERSLRSGKLIEVRYDSDFGYPENVVVTADDRYEIRDFEITN
jgi:hypothetical protein